MWQSYDYIIIIINIYIIFELLIKNLECYIVNVYLNNYLFVTTRQCFIYLNKDLNIEKLIKILFLYLFNV